LIFSNTPVTVPCKTQNYTKVSVQICAPPTNMDNKEILTCFVIPFLFYYIFFILQFPTYEYSKLKILFLAIK